MKLYEYQAKEVLRSHNILTPHGVAIENLDNISSAVADLKAKKYVVKAQVLTGGRGKAGGVKLTDSKDKIAELADEILGMDIKGHLVEKVYIEEGVNIDSEIYFSFMFDRGTGRHLIICSNEGGMDIEEVAETMPEKVLKLTVDPLSGLMPYHIREILSYLPYPIEVLRKLSKFVSDLYKVFQASDAELLEINPLVITKEQDVVACDAKMILNENSLFRQKNIASKNAKQDDSIEAQAKAANLSYVKLDGNIGCMVNGAGLAMATMDVISHFGGRPANFLDIGGGAKAATVKKALEIILSDDNVKAILVNIFGGIVRTDEVAKGIVAASNELNIQVPIVIRLVGTNEEEALKLLSDNGFTALSDSDTAIKEIVKKVKA